MITVKDGLVKTEGDTKTLYVDLMSVVGVMKMHLPIGLLQEAIERGLCGQVEAHDPQVMELLEYILERRDAQKNEGTTDKSES